MQFNDDLQVLHSAKNLTISLDINNGQARSISAGFVIAINEKNREGYQKMITSADFANLLRETHSPTPQTDEFDRSNIHKKGQMVG